MTWNEIIDSLYPGMLYAVDWKLCAYLYESTNQGTEPVSRTQTSLAQLTGISRASVIRASYRLKAKGIISVEKIYGKMARRDEPMLEYTWTWSPKDV